MTSIPSRNGRPLTVNEYFFVLQQKQQTCAHEYSSGKVTDGLKSAISNQGWLCMSPETPRCCENNSISPRPSLTVIIMKDQMPLFSIKQRGNGINHHADTLATRRSVGQNAKKASQREDERKIPLRLRQLSQGGTTSEDVKTSLSECNRLMFSCTNLPAFGVPYPWVLLLPYVTLHPALFLTLSNKGKKGALCALVV